MGKTKDLRNMVARLARELEPFAFGGGQRVCKFCGAGFVREKDGMWKPNLHAEYCLLRQAERLAGLGLLHRHSPCSPLITAPLEKEHSMGESRMEYKTVIARHSVDLDCRVNGEIAKGWRPLGGAGVSATRGDSAITKDSSITEYIYIQAMVRAQG